jgi:hypothetical protein
MSYSDMKSKIDGELVTEPAHVAAHVGATLRATFAGIVAVGGVTCVNPVGGGRQAWCGASRS